MGNYWIFWDCPRSAGLVFNRNQSFVPSLLVRKGARDDQSVRPPMLCRHPRRQPHTRTKLCNLSPQRPTAQPPIRQNDCNSPSARWLKTLEASLVWEGRTLWVVAACPLAFFIYQPAGMAIGGVGILIIVVMVRVHFYFAGWFCRH